MCKWNCKCMSTKIIQMKLANTLGRKKEPLKTMILYQCDLF